MLHGRSGEPKTEFRNGSDLIAFVRSADLAEHQTGGAWLDAIALNTGSTHIDSKPDSCIPWPSSCMG